MKQFTWVVLALLLFLISCCDLGVNEKSIVEEKEPVYIPSVAWTLDTDAYKMWTRGEQFGRFFYIPESNWYFIYYNQNESLQQNLAKIDLETGSYVWKTPTETYGERTHAVLWNGYVFVLYKNGVMRCYNDSDGTLAASIRFGVTERESLDNACKSSRMIAYDGYLYWANLVQDFSRPWGVMRFDPDSIDFSKDPYEEQLLYPSLIWRNSERSILAEPVISTDGILYFLTYNASYPESGYSILGAVDCTAQDISDNKALLWDRELSFMKGITRNSLLIEGDSLFVIDMAFMRLDRKTGETISQRVQTPADFQTETVIAASTFLDGVFYHDGKIYYTGQSYSGGGSDYGVPEQLVKNIFCIDASNGATVWTDIPKGGGSLGTRPIVHNNTAYVVSDCGLRVYDATTGRLIGVDTTVDNPGEDPNAYWNGKIIFFNYNRSREKAVLTAIIGD